MSEKIIQWLANTSAAQSLALKLLRHFLTVAGGALASWMLSKGVSADVTTQAVGDISSLVMIGVGVALSMADYKAVGLKIERAGLGASALGVSMTTSASAPITPVQTAELPPVQSTN